jgi:hypothetical protein
MLTVQKGYGIVLRILARITAREMANLQPHGYAVGYMTSPAARARFGLPALQRSSFDVK